MDKRILEIDAEIFHLRNEILERQRKIDALTLERTKHLDRQLHQVPLERLQRTVSQPEDRPSI